MRDADVGALPVVDDRNSMRLIGSSPTATSRSGTSPATTWPTAPSATT
jgi:hypothetical protein